VKAPRFRFAWIMVAVAIAAFDFGAIRAVFDLESRFLFFFCVLVIPMANILAVGLLLAFLRPRSRDFLKGFEVFGAIALVFVAVLAVRAEGLVQFYLIPPMVLYGAIIGPPPPMVLYGAIIGSPPPIRQSWPFDRLLVGSCLLSLWATWPQLAFALMGGFRSRRSGATGRPDRFRC
jgi:hypothetical protein